MGFGNIIDADGIALSLSGMAIVFVALILVSLYITWLPGLLPLVDWILPELEHPHGVSTPKQSASAPQSNPDTDSEIVAALGVVLHRRQQRY